MALTFSGVMILAIAACSAALQTMDLRNNLRH